MKEILEKINAYFKDIQPVYFATAKENQPFVRPVTLISLGGDFFVVTSTNDAKVKQLKSNAKFEYCLPLFAEENAGYIRGKGEIKFITDKSKKEYLFKNVVFIRNFWKSPDDEDFEVLKLEIKAYELMVPGEILSTKITL